jgi:hypothetical protein
MYAANHYVIRHATDGDAEALRRLAALDSQPPLNGRILIGEIGGEPAAAVALDGTRSVADPFRHTGELLISLRLRASALTAYEATPHLPQRLLDGLAPRLRSLPHGVQA